MLTKLFVRTPILFCLDSNSCRIVFSLLTIATPSILLPKLFLCSVFIFCYNCNVVGNWFSSMPEWGWGGG